MSNKNKAVRLADDVNVTNFATTVTLVNSFIHSWREAFSHSIPPMLFVARTICQLPFPEHATDIPVFRQIWRFQEVHTLSQNIVLKLS